MADEQVNAVARVHVDVEVIVGPYGNGWNVENIMKQARREAPEAIEHMISTSKRVGTVRVVGTPTVSVVITSEKKLG
jgi:hypothetical protein